MAKARTWTDKQLRQAVQDSYSVRQVIGKLGLVPAGGNYVQVQKAITDLHIETTHFTGKGWRKNKTFTYSPKKSLAELLQRDTDVQSYKLKKRLFFEKVKTPQCELCGWAEMSEDGRIPVELDHVNGDRRDNRLENLRILCPNCHSLQTTHRGLNHKHKRPG